MRLIRRSLALIILLLCASCISSTSEPLPEPTVVVRLPEECYVQATDLSVEYNILGYEQDPCKLMAQSPDSNVLAYVRLEEKVNPCRSNSLAGVDVVKVVHQSNIPAEIYQAVYFRIMTLEWLDDGRLLIWDAPTDLEESPGVTVVYDPRAGGIVRRLPFPLAERVAIWNTPKNAFYTAVFSSMESKCTEYMGGYDFAHERELPPFEPGNEPSQHVHIVGNPVWSEDGTQLLVSVSSGTLIGDSPCGDGQIEWGPSSVMMLDLNAKDLRPVIVKGDNEHNYYLQIDSSGRYEIISEPYSPSYSQCCRCC